MSINLTPKRTISVQTDSEKVESVARRGQRCNAMIQSLRQIYHKQYKYTAFHRIPVGRWFVAGNWEHTF